MNNKELNLSNGQDNSPYSLKSEVIYTCNHHILYVSGVIDENKHFDDILHQLRKAGGDDILEVRVSSVGGDVSAGQRVIAVMEEMFKGRNITVLDPEGSSMAAMIFLAGDKRVVYAHSVCMLHNYSMGIFGKGGEIGDRYVSTNKSMNKYLKTLIMPYVTKKEFKRILDGKDLYLDAKMLCKRGAATHVIYDGVEMEAKAFLALKKNKSLFMEEGKR